MEKISPSALSAYIDHTLLKPNATLEQMKNLCTSAVRHSFAAVCVPPYFIPFCKKALADSSVKIATVIDFPFGFGLIQARLMEINSCIDLGVDEVDVVVCLPSIANKDWDYFRQDMEEIIGLTTKRGVLVKFILETALRSNEELMKICEICNDLEPDFVKTSTGYNGGAILDTFQLLRKNLKPKIKLKVSGGIKSYAQAINFIRAGADRLGTSSGIKIMENE